MKMRSLFSLASLLTFLTTLQLLSMTRADIVNSYPYMWPDSFDWIVNGIYYLEKFIYGFDDSFPTLRQPFYPFIIALTFLLDSAWLLIVLQQVIFLAGLFALFKILQSLKVHPLVLVAGAIILLFHNSYNLLRLYLMADVYATTCLYYAVYFFMRAFREKDQTYFFRGALFSAIGSCFQFYVIFPVISACACIIFLAPRATFKFRVQAALISVVPALVLQGGWSVFKLLFFESLNAGGVKQFGYLALTLRNLDFYTEVLKTSFFCVYPLLFFFALYLSKPLRERFLDIQAGYLFVLCLMFFCAIFFYQWREARFYYYIFPLLLSLALFVIDRICKFPEKLNSYSVTTYILALACSVYVCSVPPGYVMRPRFDKYLAMILDPKEGLRFNVYVDMFFRPREARFQDVCVVRTPKKSDGNYKVRKGCYQYKFGNIVRYLEFRARQKQRAKLLDKKA